MHTVLVYTILGVLLMFVGLTAAIVIGKGIREIGESFRRRRRRQLEPAVLKYAHGETASLLPALGGMLGRRDRPVVEEILLDHIQRVRGDAKARLGRALDELGYIDRHIDGLTAARWWKRADSAEKLGVAGVERARGALVGALQDDVPEVRIRAAKALGAVGGQASMLPLIDALRQPDRWSALRVADILSEMGPKVVDELIEAFPTLEVPARLAAIDVVGRIRPLESVPWLAERIDDDDADVRARAADALGAIGEPDSAHPLQKALVDAAWPVRAMAAKALGRIGNPSALEALKNALRDAEWWVRANAAEALRAIGEPGIEALDRALDDDDAFARHQAVLMLEESGRLDRRVARLTDADPDVRGTAEQWIDRWLSIGQTGRIVELALRHDDADVRARLVERLRAAGIEPPASEVPA